MALATKGFMGNRQAMYPAEMQGEVIALDSRHCYPGRQGHNYRLVTSHVNFDEAREVLDYCIQHHQDTCQVEFAKELLVTKMVDVRTREVVDCPLNCDYVALSYCWGGIVPALERLRTGGLPRTIEDAITATRLLGRDFVWVRAPYEEQDKARSAQLTPMPRSMPSV
jgi:hypothetical protein